MIKGYKRKAPDSEGWWLFIEEGDSNPQRLYVVGCGDYTEIADDTTLAEKIGGYCEEHEVFDNHGNLVSNWFEMTPTAQMQGIWKKEIVKVEN